MREKPARVVDGRKERDGRWPYLDLACEEGLLLFVCSVHELG